MHVRRYDGTTISNFTSWSANHENTKDNTGDYDTKIEELQRHYTKALQNDVRKEEISVDGSKC